MCGIAGFLDLQERARADPQILQNMLNAIAHRGPDGEGAHVIGPLAMGARRLSIIDIDGSSQPILNEGKNLVLVGNGEIFNYLELREKLLVLGHEFRTNGDLEVIIHLFEEYGSAFTEHVNGQYSLAIYDYKNNELNLYRDNFGITPLFYAIFENFLIFSSEIKGILQHPAVRREVNLTGLDQIVCFPGLVSPETMFAGIRALKPGHRLRASKAIVEVKEFWDLDYPTLQKKYTASSPDELAATFLEHFDNAVKIRMRTDRSVGVYLSGGLDSSFVASSMRNHKPTENLVSFSMIFPEATPIDERRFQQLMAKTLSLDHIEVPFSQSDLFHHLRDMIWHTECPVKESYNICSFALSREANAAGIPVILGGEGADELLAGYPGYRLDSLPTASRFQEIDASEALIRRKLWGASSIRYERMYHRFSSWRRQLFSRAVLDRLPEFDCLGKPPINISRLAGRHPIHQRSYIDIKLRLSDHLLGDHGDRMAMANSVEARYPFLDRHVVDFVRDLPPSLKIDDFNEKILLKKASAGRVPDEIINREKFGFRAPGSPFFLRLKNANIDEYLDPVRIRRQGYLNEKAISYISSTYRSENRNIDPYADDDLVLIALTFSLFIDLFKMPDLS